MTTPQLKFRQWFEEADRIKEVADKWFRPDGSAKTRSMTQTKIVDTMNSYGLDLMGAAKLLEQAILYYSNQHVVGGAQAYWSLVKEMAGTGAIVGSCASTADYQVWGACSDKESNGKRSKKRKRRS